ncbi:hypothetical protein MLD38_009170 [Melastoma candidum]|uniref:Uncharacterized protein n=1 Tax=Melastoma candidum TaxID=119954 RepID=A0ACB9RY42_9MYRT|nr:hypothetical protein MLD38_009170 [Melastoma candidum]
MEKRKFKPHHLVPQQEATDSLGLDQGGRDRGGDVLEGRSLGVLRKGYSGCCQVESCRVDLRNAKQYHRRHRVCENHAKAQVVLVSGIRQRFCQQCSRFHDVSEFDESKRSCRKRLAMHNERRRKHPTEPPFQ